MSALDEFGCPRLMPVFYPGSGPHSTDLNPWGAPSKHERAVRLAQYGSPEDMSAPLQRRNRM